MSVPSFVEYLVHIGSVSKMMKAGANRLMLHFGEIIRIKVLDEQCAKLST
jgi:hypothetical protein